MPVSLAGSHTLKMDSIEKIVADIEKEEPPRILLELCRILALPALFNDQKIILCEFEIKKFRLSQVQPTIQKIVK